MNFSLALSTVVLDLFAKIIDNIRVVFARIFYIDDTGRKNRKRNSTVGTRVWL